MQSKTNKERFILGNIKGRNMKIIQFKKKHDLPCICIHPKNKIFLNVLTEIHHNKEDLVKYYNSETSSIKFLNNSK